MSVSKLLHQHLLTPPIKLDHQEPMMKQGIVTVLIRSDSEITNKPAAASIRRTLSADMSSKKWLQQNWLMNGSDSSSSVSSDDEERPGHDDIWKSIQSQKQRNDIPNQNVWGSLILSEKSGNRNSSTNSTLPPPYVHPLLKKSASTLSKKSLEICTESLGSETGSDCFSSIPSSEFSDKDYRQRQEEIVKESSPVEDFPVAKYKASPVRPFPPPLPSMTGGDGAGGVHMHSRRENGRLVLEAVSSPPKNVFHAHREDGRLVLTMVNSQNENETVDENKVEVFDKMEDGFENADEVDDTDTKIEAKSMAKELEFHQMDKKSRLGVINVNKTGLVMKKLMASSNKNPTWSKKLANVKDADVEEEEEFPVQQSLPPLHPRLIPTAPLTTATTFNAYDYFWRNKNTVSGSFINPMIATAKSTPFKNNYRKIDDQELILVEGKTVEDFPPYLRACKDGRRTLLIWEPHCIATS